MHNLEIVYEDDALVVINKPAGLLSVPGLSSDTNALDLIKQAFPNSRVVHRLDMATSGLLIFPQSYQAHRYLGQLFEQRKIYKTYTAVVSGIMKQSAGEISVPMLCDWENRPKQKIDFIQGKFAQTHYSVLSRDHENNTTRVKLEPHTGRSHQLRVHMQHLGHAIVGDPFYSNDPSLSERMLLHATTLIFEHPGTNKRLTLDCAPNF